MPKVVAMIAATALAFTGMITSTQAAEDAHHPGNVAPQAQAAAPGQSGMMMGGMGQGGAQQGMMGNMQMMNMMNMMNMMQAMQMSGGPIDRIEGRIAFLRAELKITDAQDATWNRFADALRLNAQRLGQTHAAMTSAMAGGATQPLTQRLETQERALTARLEGARALRAAYTTLSAALSEEQKKTAEELLAPHMGMGPMGMGMGGF